MPHVKKGSQGPSSPLKILTPTTSTNNNKGVKASTSLKEFPPQISHQENSPGSLNCLEGILGMEDNVTCYVKSKPKKSASCSRISGRGIPNIVLNRQGVISFVTATLDDDVNSENPVMENPHWNSNVNGTGSRSSSRGRTRTRIRGNSSNSHSRGQSPRVRIQVTLHKPLNWQVSASSSSNSSNLVTSKSVKKSKSPGTPSTFSISPSSTFSKENPSESFGSSENPKTGKCKVRFTDLENSSSSKSHKNLAKNSVRNANSQESFDQKEGDKANKSKEVVEDDDGQCECSCTSLKQHYRRHVKNIKSIHHNMDLVLDLDLIGVKPQSDSSTDDDDTWTSVTDRNTYDTGTSVTGRRKYVREGFDERNRLRSKSVNNRAQRRKRRSRSKSRKNLDRILNDFPESSEENKNKSKSFPVEEGLPLDLVCGDKKVDSVCGAEKLLVSKEKDKETQEGQSVSVPKVREEESEGIRGRKHHSSFVVRLGQKPKLRETSSKSFELPLKEKENRDDIQRAVSPVMTWFKGPSHSHDTNKESGMGANGSAQVDGRLKSRSQSSSALYCIGKSGAGGGNGLEYPAVTGRPYYNNYNHGNCYPGPGNSTNGFSHSIPADIWDLPPTTKSFSPLNHQKHNNVQTPNYHHHIQSGNPNVQIPLTAISVPNQSKSLKHRGAMPTVVDAITCRGKKGSKGGKNRSKLYAVSCPDVAQHTQCANADHRHNHGHPNLDYNYDEYNSRLGITLEGIEHSKINNGGGGFPFGIVPEGYNRSIKKTSHNNGQHQHHNYPVISNLQLTQSHPHLYLNNSKSTGGVQLPPQQGQGGQSQSGGGISTSYQNISQSFYPHQEHLKSSHHHNSSSNVTHHQHQIQSHSHRSCSTSLIPQNSQRGKSNLQNQQSCDFSNSQEDPNKCSLYFPIPAFVIPENIFEVQLQRDQRGLGLSVTGGLDSKEKYPGLIRIKKVFPMSPASHSGNIAPFDIILQANGVPLTGLTNHEALEVLRTTPMETVLTLCRPPQNVPGFMDSENSQVANFPNICDPIPNLMNSSTQQEYHHQSHSYSQSMLDGQEELCPPPPQFDNENGYTSSTSSAFNPSVKSKSLSSLKIPTNLQNTSGNNSFGEFEVTLEKVGGSLGFTLRQEDSSILGHYVRALVKDPAVSDGRIKPGDRIVSVNGKDLSEMSHAEAINFLRQCPPQVTLRLYRDTSPTPISPLSPTQSHKSIKAKPLRQEAIDMLNDLAIRKQMSSGSSSDPKYSSSSAAGRTGLRSHKVSQHDANCPATLPRRRHPAVTPSPQVLSAALSRFAGSPQKSVEHQKGGQEEEISSNPNKSSRDRDRECKLNAKPKKTTSSSSIGSGSTLSGHDEGPQNQNPNQNYPAETRSSGSGESTPVGTIIQHKRDKKNLKTDPYRGYSDLRSDSIISTRTDTSINEDEGVADTDNPFSDNELNHTSSNKNKKTSFRQFTLHLDQISSLDEEGSFNSDLNHHDSIVSEPGGKRGEMVRDYLGDGRNFRHGQPAYQSAIVPSTCANKSRGGKGGRLNKENFGSGFRLGGGGGGDSPTALSDIDVPSSTFSFFQSFTTANSNTNTNTQQDEIEKERKGGGKSKKSESSSSSASDTGKNAGSLQKWKGVLFSKDYEDQDDTETTASSDNLHSNHRKPVGSSSGSSDHGKKLKQYLDVDDGDQLPRRQSPDGREFRECDMEISSTTQLDGEQIFTVQLSRRWCSRLGFSLQGSEGHTYISAIYPDSVAAKDGRLRVGDEVVMVNGETIRDLETTEVIDNMRKTRGIISITILRKPSAVDPDINTSDSELGLR